MPLSRRELSACGSRRNDSTDTTRNVADAIKEVNRLAGLQIAVKLPGIDASLAALDAYKGEH